MDTTSGVTTITTDTILIPTYNYSQALFWQTNATYNIPYPALHWANYGNLPPAKSDKAYTRLTLENDWLRVSILPELGGRVYEMIFKPTGNNELYQNPVIKPTHWGPPEQGWWLAAGGIEWGLPVEEHGYESAIPWAYTIVQSSAGITVTLRDSTQADRLRAAVDVFLPNDRAVLILRPRIENARSTVLNFKWWANAMLAPGPNNTVGPDLRFIFPIDAVTVHSTGDSRLPGYAPSPSQPDKWITWPIFNGVDWSRLGNFDQWFGFFGRPQAQWDFVGVYDTSANEGVVRVFPRTIATGIKGFAMGWAHPIDPGNWTDDGSTYVELHGGLAPTFWDSVSLDAGQSIEWEEAWYPVAGIGAFTAANAEAALKVEQSSGVLNLGVFSTRARGATQVGVWQRSTCNRIAKRDFASIDPATPRTFAVPTGIPLSDLAILFTEGDSLIIGTNEQDCVAPASTVNALPNVSPTNFSVSWTGGDFYTGIASYDVQFKDGYAGAWTAWLTATTQTSSLFNGAHGHTYFFRSRARDAQGNPEAYSNGEWGDAFTTVLTGPAAVMETSRLSGPAFFAPGQPVSATVILSNTGNLTGNIVMTDTLPVSMTLLSGSLSASSGPAPTFDGSRILWSGIITDNASVLIAYALTPTLGLGFMQPQTSTLVVTGGVVPVTRTAVASMARLVYLPLITRNYSP
ncbi:MAG TPA: DUF5107 domain-containing protein [Anaerolineae bacterium]